jgi:hypothetical protein
MTHATSAREARPHRSLRRLGGYELVEAERTQRA